MNVLGRLGFENAYAFAVRTEQAEALGLRTMSDLIRHAPTLSIGADYEFFERPEWEALTRTYGFAFAEQTTLDPALRYRAVAAGQVDVVAAYTTDGQVAAYDLTLLSDDRQAFPPYDAILLVAPALAQDEEILSALRPYVDAIDTDTMRDANKMVDVDGQPVAEAASWIQDHVRTR